MDMDALGAVNQFNTGQSTYDSIKAEADAVRFSQELKNAQQKTAAASTAAKTATQSTDVQDKKLRDACEGFEEMFLDLMYKQMRATVPEDGLFGDSNADKILESMRDDQMMKQVAASGGVGLADMLYKQLKSPGTPVHSGQQVDLKK